MKIQEDVFIVVEEEEAKALPEEVEAKDNSLGPLCSIILYIVCRTINGNRAGSDEERIDVLGQ